MGPDFKPVPAMDPGVAPALVPEPAPALVSNPAPTLISKPAPALDPALVPVLVQEVQAASNREAAGTESKVERPKRSRTVNKFFSENYVLDTESIGTQLSRRPRSLSVTSNRRSGSDPTKPPSIRPFLKPTGATSKTGQNESLPKSTVTSAKSHEDSNFEAKVS